MFINFLKKIRTIRRVKKKFKKKLGYPLNLRNPKTYCEKIQWLKFNHIGNDEKIITRTDKYAVRSFIESKGFGEHLVPLYGSWSKPEEIDWKKLPNRFVLKWNNGSGPKYRWLVKDKSLFSKKQFEIEAKAALDERFGEGNGEFHYVKIPPKIIAEEYLEDGHRDIKDYRFYCFHGKITFVRVLEGIAEGSRMSDYYDLDWNQTSVHSMNDLSCPILPFKKPDNFEQMVVMAETLSQGYPHVRVDLYNIAGKVYFGELTYTPANGIFRWNPPSLDLEFGQMMNIHDISH